MLNIIQSIMSNDTDSIGFLYVAVENLFSPFPLKGLKYKSEINTWVLQCLCSLFSSWLDCVN